MSDCASTVFWFPLGLVNDPQARLILPDIFGEALPTDPQPNRDEGFGRDAWQGHGILSFNDPNARGGGWELEHALITAGLPFVRYNAAGADYGPSLTASDGQSFVECNADRDGYAVVAVEEAGIDPQALADVAAFYRLRRAVLSGESALAAPSPAEPAAEEEALVCPV